MAARYYVWGAGSWRELDVAAGCVAGWRRRARFVFVRRGRLQVARRRAVLRALAALAAGRPGAAADGPRLSQLRMSPVSGIKLRPRARRGPVPHCHCSMHHNGCVEPPLPAAPGRREAATQCATTERSLNINMPPAPAPPSSSEEPSPPPPRRALRNTMSEVTALLAPAPPAPRPAPVTDSSLSDERPLAQYASGAGGGGAVKELVISDGDVAALRGFVARSRPSALARFDADAAYKCALFYAINPLVELRRCARLERLLQERRDAALPHFAARLGLAPAEPAASPAEPGPARRRRHPSDSTDADKENKEQLPSPKKARTERSSKNEASSPAKQTARPSRAPLGSPPVRTTKTEASASAKRVPRPLPPRSPPADDARLTRSSTGAKHSPSKATHGAGDVTAPKLNGAKHSPSKSVRGAGDVTVQPKLNGAASSDSDEWRDGSKVTPAPRTHVISKRPCGSKRAEYSNLEDHAIVSWVSVGARASLVNGNALWRDLQAQFPRLAGRPRTWHSLRNRYLRYILPALAALRLPPAHESRLRAAAATGVTKSSKAEKRRNSIFKEAERGASSVRPRPPPSPPTPVAPAAAAAPSKAQAAPAAVTTIKKEVQTESRTLRRSPRYSEMTRQFAARHAPRAASSTDSSPAPSPSPGGTTPSPRGGRSRRLFNPNRNV
ncbi:serine/arginine repetitive matrix protein 1-like [Helicoverpa zea]|uniref:serine/arginine repetitive matrix protein 1-like n=1 Tax=Helicoverpa zea TaxID=7113 RepID=UPI001F5AF2C0|nr:serine/arginine repetitive matrix protein 1-like [Helicoverpa zea]